MTYKEYFENKIDWRSFNYLLSLLTPYEDQEATVFLYACIAYTTTKEIKKDSDIFGIYYYSTMRPHGMYPFDRFDTYAQECYENNPKFYYKIGIKDEEEPKVDAKKCIEQIKTRIERKFNVRYIDNMLVVDKK